MTLTYLLIAFSDVLPEVGLDSRAWQRDSAISIQFSDSFDAAVYRWVMSSSEKFAARHYLRRWRGPDLSSTGFSL